MIVSNFSNQASCFNFFHARNTLGALTPPNTTTTPTIATYSPFGPWENFAAGFLQTRANVSCRGKTNKDDKLSDQTRSKETGL